MSILQDRTWRLKYTPDSGNLVTLLYEPMLESAVRYDRLTGYFAASALALAARGVEGLVANNGRMRMVVGCTLDQPEVEAIERGESLRQAVQAHLNAQPLRPDDPSMTEALELLAWLVAEGRLEIKVAVPCDAKRRPVSSTGIFHEKSGVVEDKTGDRVGFNGSLNETASGWARNWESVNVFTSWRDPERVQEEDSNFARLWTDQAQHAITMDVPTALRDDLLRFLPKDDKPARIKRLEEQDVPLAEPQSKEPAPPDVETPYFDLRRAVWNFITVAPTLAGGGERVGEVTSAVTPWPHQVRAFHRLYDHWPPKLLVADEVGLGKTVQAGLLLRQAWLARRAKRILVLAPKAVCRQWQIELREKFNLNWPIYDGQKLSWYPSPAVGNQYEHPVSRNAWHQQGAVIVSSHLVRRADRQRELLDAADSWDLVILDEAHHARRKGAGSATEGGPNALLKLMRGLKERTQGLVLLTATPMQVHPVEVFDLLSLLGLPPEWSQSAFLRFFDIVQQDSPGHEAFDELAAMFRAVERAYGEVSVADVQKVAPEISGLKAKRILRALRDIANTPRRQLETSERRVALRLMRLHTPVNRLVSRHTRELLRRYFKAGKISTPIADRRVEDRFIDLSLNERVLYEAVEDYISSTYNQASAEQRTSVGFVMTIYRRRLASSFYALQQTLEAHLRAIKADGRQSRLVLDEDIDVDDDGNETDADEAEELERQALTFEEQSEIERLLEMIRRLPPDSKAQTLQATIGELREAGYRQVMVFTQFTDTMDFLRNRIVDTTDVKIMCFSGRGGEIRASDGSWRTISRDEVKRRFRNGEADILLCTDAAAEGLNFQFCGALINYDMPWNPMRVEQRIGRIDRLGQKYPDIQIVNLHYANTVEADVYVALRHRIGLFESVVGQLQPILARLPNLISGRVLEGRASNDQDRKAAVNEIEMEAMRARGSGFDINAVTDADLAEPPRPPSPLTMYDLDRIIASANLLPPGLEATPLGPREYSYRHPGAHGAVRVSTDPAYYEQNADTVELWSPGNPMFPKIEGESLDDALASSLGELLASSISSPQEQH